MKINKSPQLAQVHAALAVLIGSDPAGPSSPGSAVRTRSHGGVIASGSTSVRALRCHQTNQALRDLGINVTHPLSELAELFAWKLARTVPPIEAMSRLRHESIMLTQRYINQLKPRHLDLELAGLWDAPYASRPQRQRKRLTP